MISQIISHYKIIEKIGFGGMGEVYLAEDTELDRKVALKIVPPNYMINQEIQARFKREGKAIAALNHPNIITIHEIAEHEGRSYLIMEYVEGQSLKDALSQKEFPVSKIIDIFSQICEGLQGAHQAGIVHRDIKPDNILLDKRGRVKIVDFGLAKLNDVTNLTKESSTMGTLNYMSPEQIQSAEVDHRSDIFSVGVVLYEMITGLLPFKGDYDATVTYSIINEEPEPLARYKTGISEELQHIVDKTLSKDPNTRYQSAAELLADLRRARKESTSAVLPGKKSHSRRYIILAGVGLLLALAIYLTLSRNNIDFFHAQQPAAALASETRWDNSIAVLPFKNISPDPEQEYFCDGMTEQIITNLSQLQNLKVIARTSVMKFKNTEKTIPEICKELHVANILEGSIRKSGNHIRVTAQLIQAEEGHHLWAENYDRELQDIFDVQDDVSEAIAGALLKKLSLTEIINLKTRGTENSEAYEFYLKAEHFHLKKFYLTGRMEDFKNSEDLFKKAIELDPSYALAYAGLAGLYNSYTWVVKNDEEYSELQQRYIDKAFALDPNSADVNLVKAHVHAFKGEWNYEFKSLIRALELNPNESLVNWTMGYFLRRVGLHHQSAQYFKRAIELDPVMGINYRNLAYAYQRLGNLDQAILYFRKALEFESDDIITLTGIAHSLIMLNDFSEAEKYLTKSEKIKPDNSNNKITRALLYAVKGKKNDALKALEDSGQRSRYNEIAVYNFLGLKDEALNLLDERPIASGGNIDGSDYLEMLHNPYFEVLHNTRQFKIALHKAKKIYDQNFIKYGKVFL